MSPRALYLAVSLIGMFAALSERASAQQFQLHARFQGVGACLKQVVAPGPERGSERLYASHIYWGEVLEIVAIDPRTGKSDVFPADIPGETGAWAMAVAKDGAVYIGTLPTAHILKLDWIRHRLVDMGRPSSTEQYIWQLALASDGKLYGCTYPSAKLVRFDPSTGRSEDLGRMDPTEQYARTVAADDRGFVYTGIGYASCHIVAYEIATGSHRDILPSVHAGAGAASVYRGDDGVVYAEANGRHYRLDGWNAETIDAGKARPERPLRLANGSTVSYGDGFINVGAANGAPAVRNRVEYKGRNQSIFRIGLGPDGWLYGSTAMPIHFFRADPASDHWEEIGQPGGGEFYSILAYGDKLMCGAYSGAAPLMVYDPGRPYAPGPPPGGNPALIHFVGENGSWRPMAMVTGADRKVYIGAVSGYGLLGGPLCIFDPLTGSVEQHLNFVTDQSVVSLAALPDGRLVGGSTVGGGGGSHPTQTDAKLFIIDHGAKTYETTPAPGCAGIDALAVASDGMVYGFAGKVMFVFDPHRGKVVKSVQHGLGHVIFNAVGAGPRGRLYGVASSGIFTIDTRGRRARLLQSYSKPIDGGFTIHGKQVFFTVGPQIVSYTIQ